MSDIGAQLPPHLLAKRKRQQEENASKGPSVPSGAKESTAQVPEGQEKRRKIAGPAMPPAPIEQMPQRPSQIASKPPLSDGSDSDDDDFGPAAPSTSEVPDSTSPQPNDSGSRADLGRSPGGTHSPKLKRDEWMTMPPTEDGLASRMDPTKQRPRGFNTGKGAKTAVSGAVDNSTWHETSEQKQKRLQDEMMGISKPNTSATANLRSNDQQKERDLRETLNKHRGPSLMDQHRKTKAPEEVEDDPSKRAFDREKDMGSGARISASQKREMLNKAADFSSRFSGGSFL